MRWKERGRVKDGRRVKTREEREGGKGEEKTGDIEKIERKGWIEGAREGTRWKEVRG